MQKLLANVYGTLGFEEKEGDTQVTLLHRVNVLTWACRLGLEDCVKNAIDIFKEYEEKAENNPYVCHNYLIRQFEEEIHIIHRLMQHTLISIGHLARHILVILFYGTLENICLTMEHYRK